MRRTPYNRHPLGPHLVVGLIGLLGVIIALFVLDALAYAYRRIGIGRGALFALVLASLLGGAINIPVARLRGRAAIGLAEVTVFGVRYRLPVVRRSAPTVIAVNVGGAVIPSGLSLLLLVENDLWWQAAIGVAVVAGIVHVIARPVPGLGIAVPAIVPPLLAASAALVISPHAPAALAYICGALGTLIGADLLHLPRLRELGAGVASIGGAGTFDGIFLSAIIALLLVS